MRALTSKLAAALGVAAALVSVVHALPQVSRRGKYLYDDKGRFYIKGIAYQEQGAVNADPNNPFGEPSDFIDPLANGNACKRDAPVLQQLGVNAIRVYSVDASLNHDTCMAALSSVGIYTIIDLSLPVNGSIDRLHPEWTTNLLNLYLRGIDAFSKYDNVLAYNIGNEVVINPNGTAAAAYVKAAARDIKAYLASKSSSALVGYAAIDGDQTWRLPLAHYLSCDPSGGNSGASAIDLYGLNSYSWCGNSTFQASYSGIFTQYSDYNVPAYFSEFGCIDPSPRVWTEVLSLFSSQMSPVFSGGLAFAYFPAQSAAGQFGMVTISSDGKTVTPNTDFNNLKTQYAAVTPPNTPDAGTAGTTSYPACPAETSAFLASSKLPPTPNDAACQCLQKILSCQFTPQKKNVTGIVGVLLDTACTLLGQAGGNCQDITGDASAGNYGRVAACDPSTKLSFVMSENYEANKRDARACSFAGNGTVNTNAPTSVSAANAAASSCLTNPSAVFTPSSGPGSSSAPKRKGSAMALVDTHGLLAVGVMMVVCVGSALLTLL